MRTVVVTVFVGCAVAVFGCATKGTLITDADIAGARGAGTLEALFARVEAEAKAEGDPPSERTAAVKAQIGSLLAEDLETELEAQLAAGRLEGGRAPLATIITLRDDALPMQRWDPTRHVQFTARLDREENATRDAIRAAEDKIRRLEAGSHAAHIEGLAELIELAGPESAEATRYEARRSELVAGLKQSADTAIQQENLSDAQQLLRMAQGLDPDNPQIGDQLVQIDAQLFERRFWKALEDGEPDAAYRMLREISSADNFEAIRARLAPSADPMADYFLALASQTTKNGNLTDAYRWFSQARSIRELLGNEQVGVRPEEAPFVDMVKKRYWQARKENQPALAWAYLSVVERLESSTPELRGMVHETREEVLQLAVTSIAALPFQRSGTGDGPDFGENVSSKVVQHLFESIPQDIRIIEREQLAAIERERAIGKKTSALRTAALMIQGDILEAKVSTQETRGRKTVRVVTETATNQNPAYLRWLELSKGERKDIAQPPAEITEEKKENVSYEVTVHRKVGIFNVSYRVIDALTGEMVYTDSASKKTQHEDNSSEGVELGDFKQEFKLASLPSDPDILAKLAEEISAEIGQQLATVLANPEERYAETARRFVDEGNFLSACEQFAYAFVLAERKGGDVHSLGEELRTSAMRTIERPTR